MLDGDVFNRPPHLGNQLFDREACPVVYPEISEEQFAMQHAPDRYASIVVNWAVVCEAVIGKLHHDDSINGAC